MSRKGFKPGSVRDTAARLGVSIRQAQKLIDPAKRREVDRLDNIRRRADKLAWKAQNEKR
jgi:hypothetical protein